jgi:hypothetical protein
MAVYFPDWIHSPELDGWNPCLPGALHHPPFSEYTGKVHSYGPLPVINNNKTPFITCIIPVK